MTDTYTFLIQTITPLHLGCDEVYEPLNVVFHAEKKCLIAFEAYDFLHRLPIQEREKFLTICRKGTVGSILEIYKFMARQANLARGREVPVAPALLAHYQRVLALPERDFSRQLNKFTIHRTAFLPADQRPYIPGSAIKGALRTAYLSWLASQQRALRMPSNEYRQLEKELLQGSFHTDPFRLVKVSDFRPVGEVKTRILYAVNLKKEGGAGHGPYQILEVVESGAWFQGTINIAPWPPEIKRAAQGLQGSPDIVKPVQPQHLWQSLRDFFQREKAREDEELFALGLPKVTLPLQNGSLPLRLGRHSGAECLTLPGYRRIKIKTAGGRAEIKDHATTLWLAALAPERWPEPPRPFGWGVLSRMTPDLQSRCLERETAWQDKQSSRTPVSIAPEEKTAVTMEQLPEPTPAPTPVQEVWENAFLTWNPGKQELAAAGPGNKRASCKGMELVPGEHQSRLKKKGFRAAVTVEPWGNAWKIVKIDV